MKHLVVQKGKRLAKSHLLVKIACAISSYICIVPLIFMDLFLWQFQRIYFTLSSIPLVNRADFVVIDRHLLPKLSWTQKLNCVYCGYANGVVGYSKAVVNQMEVYSCAIKHFRTPKGHEHHKNFFDRKKFE